MANDNSNIPQLISQFRALTAKDSITPENLGYLLLLIYQSSTEVTYNDFEALAHALGIDLKQDQRTWFDGSSLYQILNNIKSFIGMKDNSATITKSLYDMIDALQRTGSVGGGDGGSIDLSEYLKKNDAQEQYLKKNDAQEQYLKKNDAQEQYLKKNDAQEQYLKKKDAQEQYQPKGNYAQIREFHGFVKLAYDAEQRTDDPDDTILFVTNEGYFVRKVQGHYQPYKYGSPDYLYRYGGQLYSWTTSEEGDGLEGELKKFLVEGDVKSGGSTGSTGGGSSDLKKYSIWIESRESDPEDDRTSEPTWVVTKISSGLREALNKEPLNSIVELCVNLGFDLAFKVPAITTSTETGAGGVMVMATIGGMTFTVTVDDDPEQCQVSVEKSVGADVDLSGYLKGIRSYNGNVLEADENGYICTKYGDVYFDRVDDVPYKGYLELKVNPNGSIQQKIPIVTADTDNLQAEAGKLYRFDKEVNTLAVSLPDMDGSEYATDIMLMFKTGDSPSVTIQSIGNGGVEYQQGFKIEAGKHYEVNALWNGAKWVVASLEINEE